MTPAVQYTIVDTGEQRFVSVFVPGRDPQVVDDSHPNFEEILDCVKHGDCGTAVIDLIDLAAAAATKFRELSERVAVENGHVLFDGVQQDGSVESQIVRFIEEGRDDWQPLVKFMENIDDNPSQHSREQLFDWLNTNDLRIDDDGYIIGYKGVNNDGSGFKSLNSGKAYVDGVEHNGRIPNPVGSTVTMPRRSVADNPAASCSTGLHVGTRAYASNFGSYLLEVRVNPADVVSVPHDGAGEKIRVCEYRIERQIPTDDYEYDY